MQLLVAIEHIHSLNILHRDLKTQNIMLNKKRTVLKIGDFGISKVLSSKITSAQTVGFFKELKLPLSLSLSLSPSLSLSLSLSLCRWLALHATSLQRSVRGNLTPKSPTSGLWAAFSMN